MFERIDILELSLKSRTVRVILKRHLPVPIQVLLMVSISPRPDFEALVSKQLGVLLPSNSYRIQLVTLLGMSVRVK